MPDYIEVSEGLISDFVAVSRTGLGWASSVRCCWRLRRLCCASSPDSRLGTAASAAVANAAPSLPNILAASLKPSNPRSLRILLIDRNSVKMEPRQNAASSEIVCPIILNYPLPETLYPQFNVRLYKSGQWQRNYVWEDRFRLDRDAHDSRLTSSPSNDRPGSR